MANFDFLKPYIITEADIDLRYEEVQRMKHSFLPVDFARITQAEGRLGFFFPKELKEFYTQIGYGYMHQEQENYHNNFMYPLKVADAYLRQGAFDNNFLASTGLYDDSYKLLFYDAVEGCFAWMDLRETGPTSPIFYIGDNDKIANSLEEFLREYDANPNLLKEFSSKSRNRPS
jgi:hypothetical protein